MGYFTLDFKKAKGASDARMSDHIERRVIAPNVDATRTHLNRELVELPEGVTVRDEAIAHRIKSAGIKRKITPDQVRAIRVMMSGTHEDLMKIQQEGRMDEWCNDSMRWLYKTFGQENIVSAVLHMDETTPHIHATIVPIVTGERRKAIIYPKRTKPIPIDSKIYMLAKREIVFFFSPVLFLWLSVFCYLCT